MLASSSPSPYKLTKKDQRHSTFPKSSNTNNLDFNELPSILTRPSFASKDYINKLFVLYAIGFSLLILAGSLLTIAMMTHEWFVLNVNEYIPTSKGGLWNYCYIASTGYTEQFTCMRYEELPNFAVFINQRLYTSRVLLICGAAFLGLLILMEIMGVLCLLCARTQTKKFDELIEMKKNRLRLTSTPTSELNDFRFPKNSNNDAEIHQIEIELQKTRPAGFTSYMTLTLVNLVGSTMQICLNISGFVLFDAYVQRLLTYNTVFLAFKSYSYWMVIVSIVLVFVYWVFKIFTTRYVIELNKRVIGIDSKKVSDKNAFQNPSYVSGTNYNTISHFSNQNISMENGDQIYKGQNDLLAMSSTQRKSYVYDIDNSISDENCSESSISTIKNYKNMLLFENEQKIGNNKLKDISFNEKNNDQSILNSTNSIFSTKNNTHFIDSGRESPVSVMRF